MAKKQNTASASRRQDLAETRVEKLRVVCLSHADHSGAFWLCECDCGGRRIVRGYHIRKRTYKDCGCGNSPTLRFWRKVNKLPGDGCWEWTGHRSSAGYGGMHADGIRKWTHRYSWEIHNGPIPSDMCVCHKCDNPACVRPDHLFLGTKKDNGLDMARKGRHGLAKLNPASALDIYTRWQNGECTATELAKEYDVNTGTIFNIANGIVWAHATGAAKRKPTRTRSCRTLRVGKGTTTWRVIAEVCKGVDPISVSESRSGDVEILLELWKSKMWVRLRRDQAEDLLHKLAEHLK